MKTTLKVLIIAVASVLSVNSVAQNTKSLKMSHNARFANFMAVKANYAKHAIYHELKNMEAIVKYKPSIPDKENVSYENSGEFTSILAQLERDIKYIPTNISSTIEIEELNNSEFEEVLKELEQTVKFRPNQNYELIVELNEAIKELEKEVKFIPSMAI